MIHNDDAFTTMLLTVPISPDKEELARPLSPVEFARLDELAVKTRPGSLGALIDIDMSGLMLRYGMREADADKRFDLFNAAVVALRSFGDRPVHVILGGTGKGEDYGPLREPLAAYAHRAYVIGDEAGRIASAIDDVVAVTRSGTLEQAVGDAREASAAGDVILLAPACASYDQFRDFEHRGQVFTDMARTAI